jgi:hypothetical protein
VTSRYRRPNLVVIAATLRGEALWRALGFKNEKAFQRAKARGELRIPLYPIPHQSSGVFAIKADVDAFLEKKRKTAESGLEEGL